MKKSFITYRFDGIEIDVRAYQGKVYVTHDSLTGFDRASDQVKQFFKENTLERVLKLYLKKYRDKNLYIEIKCEDDKGLTNEDIVLIKETLNKENVYRNLRGLIFDVK